MSTNPGPENTGRSVLGEQASKGTHKTDAAGNLLDPQGNVATKNARGEMKLDYANVADLIDAALSINHTHRLAVEEPIVVDGEDAIGVVTVQRGLEPPTRYRVQENGRLGYVDGPRTSEAVAPPERHHQPAPESDDPLGTIVEVPWGLGASTPRTRGMTTDRWTFRMRVPVASRIDARFAEVPGDQACGLAVTMRVNGSILFKENPDAANPAPSMTVGPFAAGDVVDFTVRNIGFRAGPKGADVLADIRPA